MSATKNTRDMHLGEPGIFQKLIRRRHLESVFLFVTAKCNSKCRTCFYSSETHPGDDLSFDEIRRLSLTAPRFDKLWLSGGEPILRDDLVDIVELFYVNNGIKTVNFPTNGLLADRIVSVVARLAERCPELTIHLNFSLDGLGEIHNSIRGVKNGFKRTVAAIEKAQSCFADHPRIFQNVATVITAENLDGLYDLGLYLFKRFRLATHVFEAVRGESRDPELKRVNKNQLSELHDQLLPLYDAMADRLFANLPMGARHLAKAAFVGTTRELQRIQCANLHRPHPWGMDCTAGETTIVIDHDGGYRACELRPRLGNMRDLDFNLAAAHRGIEMRREIEAIGGGARADCWCTHTCWSFSSTKFSPRKMLCDIPLRYMETRWKRYPKLEPGLIDPGEIANRYRIEADSQLETVN